MVQVLHLMLPKYSKFVTGKLHHTLGGWFFFDLVIACFLGQEGSLQQRCLSTNSSTALLQ